MVHHYRRLRHQLVLLVFRVLVVMARKILDALRDVRRALTEAEREEIAEELENLQLRLEMERLLRDKKKEGRGSDGP